MTIATTRAPGVLPAAGTGNHLTADDTARIAAALDAAYAETTRKVYAFAWSQWASWCHDRGITTLPAEPAAVCAYLTDRGHKAASLATINAACSAIGHQHRRHGLLDPIDHDAVRQVRRGLRRLLGSGPRRPVRPLSVADLRQIITAIDPKTTAGRRDTAVILLGFAGALRRSELAGLTLADLEPKPDGLLLHVRRSKTDPEARGQVVGIAHGQHPLTDPRRSRDERAAWLRLIAVVELLPGVLDSQLRTDSGLTHFEYFVLAMLSEGPERTLRMTSLAQRTNATLPRLSHVVSRLEQREMVERFPCPEDGRATNVRLTRTGWDTLVAAAPGHVGNVRRHVFDPLTPTQVRQLLRIGEALLTRLDPDGRMTGLYDSDRSREAQRAP